MTTGNKYPIKEGDMLIVTHIDGRSEYLTDYKSLQQKRRVNGEYSLSFLLLKTERNEHSFPLAVEESLIEYAGQEYRIKKMSEKTIGLTPVKQIQADHTFFDLVDEFQYDTISGFKSLAICAAHTLAGTDYTFDVIDSFPTVEFENFGNENSLALIQMILERFGAEVEIGGKHLTFKRKIGRSTDIQFRFKHNIKTIEKFVDSSNLSTYIRGFGAKNEDGSYLVTAEYTSPLANVYGVKHAPPVVDERYTTQSGLLERLQNDLQDTPNISFSIDVAELLKAGVNTEQLELGDEIFVIYEPLDIDIQARVVEIVEYPEEPTSSQLTIANFRPNITDSVADFQRTKDRIDGIFEGKERLPYNVLPDAIRRATESLQSAETELLFESGILAVDPKNPNYLVLFNSNGIGISRDGGKTFKEAITAEGFVLSAGAIGQLNANNINVTGLIQAINNGSTTIDGAKITTGSILTDKLKAGILTGFIIQTHDNLSYPRIVLDQDVFQAINGDNSIVLNPSGYGNLPTLTFEDGYGHGAELYKEGDKFFIDCWDDFTLFSSNAEIHGENIEVHGDFKVIGGSKNAAVPTSQGMVNVSAYETAEYYFGDIGRGQVSNGECLVEIESLFKETVNTNIDYEVFLTPYGKGLIYVDPDEMTADSFTVKGDDIKFGYEIKAKRKGYETVRLEASYESEVES